MHSLTFFPKSKVAYSGSALNIDDLGYDTQYVATFESFDRALPRVFSASKDEKESIEMMQASLRPAKGYKISEVREELSAMKRIQDKMDKVKVMARGRDQFSASVMNEMQDLQEQYEAVVNGDNTNQLTIVQFVNEIVGKLEQPSYITTAFKHIALDRLRGKIPEMGWPAVTLQVGRLSEPEISNTEFGQAEFRIARNDIHIYVSREDRMEATIDPYAVSVSQGQIQMLRARELLALLELSSLQINGTFGVLADFTATGTEGVPHATNDGPKEFVNVYLGHFNLFFNYLKYFIWNPLDYRDYLSNWFSFAYSQLNAPKGFGVVPMKGMEEYGSIAIISPYVPRGFVYALTDEGAYELDGPYIVDAEYDAKKFADYNLVHDFIGYKIMNPKRFGEKLTITASPSGTEFTDLTQVYDKLKPPKDLVIKDDVTGNSP